MKKNKKILALLLSLTLILAFATKANAAEIPRDDGVIVTETSNEDLGSARAITTVSSHSGSLAPGQSVTYSFSLNWWRTIKISACGGNVSDMNGGGRIGFLASYYYFNNYTSTLDTISLGPGNYSYVVENTSTDTITYSVMFYY